MEAFIKKNIISKEVYSYYTIALALTRQLQRKQTELSMIHKSVCNYQQDCYSRQNSMQSKQNSFDRCSAEQSSSRKIKTTSNMYMFKVRAFEDVLKSRGAMLPLGQSRIFSYNTKPPVHEEESIISQLTHESTQVDQTSEQVQALQQKVQNLQARYAEAKQLCSDQLAALEESKALMEKESVRSSELEKTVQELKILVEEQRKVLDQQKVIINQQAPVMEEIKRKHQQAKGNEDDKDKVIEYFKQQIRVCSLKCQVRERNIESLKEQLQKLRTYVQQAQCRIRYNQKVKQQLERITNQYNSQRELRQKLEQETCQMKITAQEFSKDIYVLRETIDKYQIELAKISENQEISEQIKQVTEENNQLKRSNEDYCSTIQQLRKFLDDIRISHRDYVRGLNEQHDEQIATIRSCLDEEINNKNKLVSLEHMYLTGLDQLQKTYNIEVQSLKLKLEQKTDYQKQLIMCRQQIENYKTEQAKFQQICSQKQKLQKQIQEMESSKEQKDVLIKQLEVLQSVIEKQKKILNARDMTAKQLQTELDTTQQVLKQEKKKSADLQAIILNSRQTILNNLESAKCTSVREKQLFNTILEENKQLKMRLHEFEYHTSVK